MSFVTSLGRQIERRLTQPDLSQILTLLFGVILFVTATRWTGVGTAANDSWFAVAPARYTTLALLALGYGSAFSERPRQHRLASLVTVVVAALTTFPLELAAYAASHPATPFWWGLAAPTAGVVAYFGLGWIVGRVSTWLRIRSLLPLTVPALLVGLVALDLRMNVAAVATITTATTVAPLHAALAVIGAAATLLALLSSRAPVEDGDER